MRSLSRFGLRLSDTVGRGRLRFFCSEQLPGEVTSFTGGEIGIASGAPEDIYKRRVLIYAPARTAGQQGKSSTVDSQGKGPGWRLSFETQQKWENALIGWTSTADPLHSVAANTLNFFTKEEAEAFCKKHGWAYEVLPPKLQTETRPKRFIGYGDNYSVKRHGYPQGGLKSEHTEQKPEKTEHKSKQ